MKNRRPPILFWRETEHEISNRAETYRPSLLQLLSTVSNIEIDVLRPGSTAIA